VFFCTHWVFPVLSTYNSLCVIDQKLQKNKFKWQINLCEILSQLLLLSFRITSLAILLNFLLRAVNY